MTAETLKELDDFFRSMRQAFGSGDMKSLRSHYWTDKRFVNIDISGRVDRGWGPYEELMDQEFRYMDSVELQLKDLEVQAFDGRYAVAVAGYRLSQVDPGGHESTTEEVVSYSLATIKDSWRITQQHESPPQEA